MIDHPRMGNIRVALNRLRRSPGSHKEPTSTTVTQQAMTEDPVQTALPDNAEQDPGLIRTTLQENEDGIPHQDAENHEEETPAGDNEMGVQRATSTVWTSRLRPRQTATRGCAS